MKIIDITKELFSAAVYPGDPVPRRRQVSDIEKDGYALTELFMGTHSGTHIDAPRHFIQGGSAVSDIVLDACMGKCAVCDNISSVKRNIERGITRIILKNIDVNADFAREIADRIVLLGTNDMSFGGDDASAVHKILLGKGVVLLESLDLDGVDEKEYDIIALSLKLSECDGSPVRAILTENE